ncbi:hypothetical protein HDU97_006325 [Phlyctochytrium planicorne]|nr:hypothetical protein HDU97_006325 [Phlyctochytrium planicorne]
MGKNDSDSERETSDKPKVFNGDSDKFYHWSYRMEGHLTQKGLWDVVENGIPKAADEKKPTAAETDQINNAMAKSKKAKAKI